MNKLIKLYLAKNQRKEVKISGSKEKETKKRKEIKN